MNSLQRNSPGAIAINIVVTVLVALLLVFAFWMGKWYVQYIKPALSPITAVLSPTTTPGGTVATSTNPPAYVSTTPPVAVTPPTPTTTPQAPTLDYYANVAAWETADISPGKFSIAYPIDFPTEAAIQPTSDPNWRMDAGADPGNLAFTLTIPRAVESQTNFNEARLTVGYSSDATAVKNCYNSDVASTNVTINGTTYRVFKTTGAAAGNRYDSASYRTIRNKTCYAVEYTIHSSVIENYPTSYGLHPFNLDRIRTILQRIIGTIKLK